MKTFILYGVLFCLVVGGAYLLLTRVFVIREIRVLGGGVQVEVREERMPKTLLFFPSEKIRAQLLADNPILADIQFKKKYPGTLVIVPTMRTPFAILATDSRRVSVSEEGFVLGDADTATVLPVITATFEGIRVGQKISNPGVLTSLKIIRGMQEIMPMTTVTIMEEGLVRARAGKLDILFTQQSDAARLMSTLQTLVTGFRIKGTLPSVIDVRFDKPIVRF